MIPSFLKIYLTWDCYCPRLTSFLKCAPNNRIPVKKKRTITKSEDNPNGMMITPEMGNNIVLSVLQKCKSHISHVSAEISEHGLEQPMPIDNMN